MTVASSAAPRAIVVDTKEKIPWPIEDADPERPIVRAHLAAGDYSLLGMESLVAIERKSIEDLVRTVIHDRKRFHAELAILSRMRFAAIIVDGSFVDVALGRYPGGSAPASVIAATAGITVGWKIPVLYAGNRGGAAVLAVSLLRHAEKNYAPKQ